MNINVNDVDNNRSMCFETVLITGIKGSGASYLAEYIIDKHPEASVHGIARWHSTDATNRNLRNVENAITVHDCDLMDISRIIAVLKIVKPDVIFHFASHSNVKTSFLYPLAVMQNNIMGTANLFEALRICDMNPIFITIGTSEVYGNVKQEDIPITENHAIQPVNPYAVSKLAQESLAYAYHKSYGLNVIRTRAFTYLNPRRGDIFATSFARQITEIELGLRKTLLHGNLNSVRTIIDVRDCVEAYWIAAERGKIGEVYNIGGAATVSVGEFLQTLINRSICNNIPTELNNELIRPIDITLQIPDVTKFREQTGWKPRYTFKDSIDLFLNEIRHDVCFENELHYGDYYK